MKSSEEVSSPRGRNHNRIITLITAITGGLLAAATWRIQNMNLSYESYLVGNVVVLFFVPMLVILLLGEEPASFGFSIGDSRKVKWISILLFIGVVAVAYPASKFPAFQSYYPIFRRWYPYLGTTFSETNHYHLLYGWVTYGMYLFFWEFYFRGYLLFGLARTSRWAAVIAQAIVFGLLHYGKVPSEVIGAFGAGLGLGILALKSKSFVPCFAIHWGVSVVFDILVLFVRHGWSFI